MITPSSIGLTAAIGSKGRAVIVPNQEAIGEFIAGRETASSLARKCGVAIGTILNGLREMGVATVGRGRPFGTKNPPRARKLQLEQIPLLLAMYDDGIALREIGTRLGISFQRVLQIACSHGRDHRRALKAA